MTTIAFDGHTLAGDRQSTIGNTPVRTRKVFKAKDHLIGCAGDTGDCQAYVRWATGKTDKPPAFGSLIVMSIDRKLRIWCATERMNWERRHAMEVALHYSNTFDALTGDDRHFLTMVADGKRADRELTIARPFGAAIDEMIDELWPLELVAL